MQTILGLNRNEDGLLWDPYIANIVKIPHCMYWDPLHCEYASGGNVQYLLNAFALELISHGITMLDLDTFTQTCKGHSLGKKFWRKRVVHTRGKHNRAFASETMDALHVLAIYCDADVQHTGGQGGTTETVARDGRCGAETSAALSAKAPNFGAL